MPCSVNRRDEPNPVLWLDTQMEKLLPSCPLASSLGIPQEKFPWKPLNKSFIDHACLVKIPGCCMAFSFFCRFLNFHFILIDKKKLGHNQAILTLHLVNNPYVLWSNICHALMLSNEMSSMHVQLLDLDILWVAMRPRVCLHEIIETEASKWRRCRHWRET